MKELRYQESVRLPARLDELIKGLREHAFPRSFSPGFEPYRHNTFRRTSQSSQATLASGELYSAYSWYSGTYTTGLSVDVESGSVLHVQEAQSTRQFLWSVQEKLTKIYIMALFWESNKISHWSRNTKAIFKRWFALTIDYEVSVGSLSSSHSLSSPITLMYPRRW